MIRDDILDTPTPNPMPGDMVPLLFPSEWHLVAFVILAIVGFFNIMIGILEIAYTIILEINRHL